MRALGRKPASASQSGGRRGFTLVELLVVAGMLVVLVAIFVPYVASVRESRNRVACADNLRQINFALQQYARDNRQCLPRVMYDLERSPNSWVTFTGGDCDDPFVDGATVRPNDVTASLWLLVRTQKTPTKLYVCPSTNDRADLLVNEQGKKVTEEQRGNFRSSGNLSYAYANPFSAVGYQTTDSHPPYYALLADRGPGLAATEVKHGAAALALAPGNSRSHGGTGQNVLFSYGNVEFMSTPYCGSGWVWGDKARRVEPQTGDNIYTALKSTPLSTGEVIAPNEPGVIGEAVGPAWKDDAYLVPYQK